MKAKIFSKIIFFTITFFVLYNLIIWNFYTKNILIRSDKTIVTGDLSRIGYLEGFIYKRKNQFNLEKLHLNHDYDKNSKVDILTIGDSFSNGEAGGLNRYYQDYIASLGKYNVLNISQIKDTNNYIESILFLLKTSFFKNKGIKYILIESTERRLVQRFSGSIDFNKSYDTNKINIDNYINVVNNDNKLPDLGFINNGNFKFLVYSLGYLFSPNAFISKVYLEKLDNNYFSHKNGNMLLFYDKDISSMKFNSEENIKSINNNFNLLAKELKKENVELIFMPIVNKFNLYSEHLIDKNKYPRSNFFEEFRKLPKDYIFIDTKKILVKYLNKEKDLFYIDDTHWSYKSSLMVSKDIIKQLKGLNALQ